MIKSQEPQLRLVRFQNIFQQNLSLEYFELDNQSAQHAGHYTGDGETHWRVLLVANEFQGLSRVQRHQKINELVKHEFENGLHALTLQLFDLEEWALKKENYFTNEVKN